MLGDLVGLVHPREVRRLLDEVDARDERIAVLERQVADGQARWDAIDALESEGLRARRKTGRKPKGAVA